MLKDYINRYKRRNILVLLLTFIMASIQVYASVVHTFSMNALIRGDVRFFLLWNLFSLVLWGALFVINYIESVYEERTIQKISANIRDDITKRLSSTSFSNAVKKNEGTYVSWLNNDIQQIEDKGIRQYYAFWGNLFSIILSTGALIVYHYSLILVTFILMGILMKFPALFENKMSKSTLQLSEANERFIAKIQDSIAGYALLFGFNKLHVMRKLIKNASEDLSDEKVTFTKTNKVAEGYIGIVNIFSQIAIVTYTGFLAGINIVSIGALSTTGNLASTIFNSTSQSSSNLMLMKSVDVYFNKYTQFEDKLNESDTSLSINHSICLKDVSYSFDNKKVLNHLNLTFEVGKKYAIVGASGSGKSTLLNILSGRIDNFEGEILIDGKLLEKHHSKKLNTATAYTSQKPHIFNESVINNITLWDKNLNSRARNTIDKLGITSYISENGYIAENGKNLSGGQLQRIAFARSLTDENKILLLDESTANLDKATALLLENSVLDTENLTAIFVTHHLYPENEHKFDKIIQL